MTHNNSLQNLAAPKIRMFGIMLFCAIALGISFLWSQRAAAIPLPAPVIVATATDKCDKGGFFGLEPWYHFMQDSGPNSEFGEGGDPCAIQCFNILPQNTPNECHQTQSDIPGVFLAVIDDLLRIAGLVAVAFIIIGSFQYVASRGNAEKTAQAQGTVISALTGLAVALVAVAFVSFIGSKLKNGP